MPFDKHLGASGERQLELARAVAKQYVERGSAPPGYEVLDQGRQAVLEAWVDTLIPAEGEWPAASERGVAQFVDNTAAGSGQLRRSLVEMVDTMAAIAVEELGEGGLPSADLDGRIGALRRFESEHPAEFAIVLELTFEGYYRDRLVAHVVERRTGFRISGPLAGIPSEEFDQSLLSEMRSRPPHYLEVAEVAS